ncbi:hypothetical protein YC2023_020546 [Brassica napus]|uniref:(rape) hypothetical protein n=1 Tax=Brassica napus TaxID=3708 RepID=A0A816KHV5_BRANA|nr:unnamed protein product [Brassica napus]
MVISVASVFLNILRFFFCYQRDEKKPCQICGNNANDDFIMTCFKCRVTREHIYCAKVLFKAVPDMWLCEECRTSRGVIFINHDEASASNQQSDSESAK